MRAEGCLRDSYKGCKARWQETQLGEILGAHEGRGQLLQEAGATMVKEDLPESSGAWWNPLLHFPRKASEENYVFQIFSCQITISFWHMGKRWDWPQRDHSVRDMLPRQVKWCSGSRHKASLLDTQKALTTAVSVTSQNHFPRRPLLTWCFLPSRKSRAPASCPCHLAPVAELPAPVSQAKRPQAVSLMLVHVWGFLHSCCPGSRRVGVARWGRHGQVWGNLTVWLADTCQASRRKGAGFIQGSAGKSRGEGGSWREVFPQSFFAAGLQGKWAVTAPAHQAPSTANLWLLSCELISNYGPAGS